MRRPPAPPRPAADPEASDLQWGRIVPAGARDLRAGCEDAPMAERRRVASGSPFEPTIGFSRALRVGDRVLVAGAGPGLPEGGCPPGAGGAGPRGVLALRAPPGRAGGGRGALR